MVLCDRVWCIADEIDTTRPRYPRQGAVRVYGNYI